MNNPIPAGFRPSPGFIFLLGSWCLLGVFLLWGYSRPALDQVWVDLMEVSYEDRDLTDTEVDNLLDSIGRFPGLGLELLDGKGALILEEREDGFTGLRRFHILVDGQNLTDRNLSFSCMGWEGEALTPMATLSEDPGAIQLELSAGGTTLQLPEDPGPRFRILEVRVKGNEDETEPQLRCSLTGQSRGEEGEED